MAIEERTDGPVFLAADGRRLDRHRAGRIVRATVPSSRIQSRALSVSASRWYSAVTVIRLAMLILNASRSSHGIQYSKMVRPPAWRTFYRSRKSQRASNLVM